MAKGLVEQLLAKQAWVDQVADALQPIINDLFNNSGQAGRTVKDALNGVWLGHPVHPMITDVPVGAWTLAQVFDVVSAQRGDDAGLDNASDLAVGVGVVAAVGAAATGFTDWSEVGGIQRKMGLVHGLLNAVSLVFYLGSLALRLNGGDRARARTLSATGYLISATAAYVGGDLVFATGQAVNRNAWVDGPEDYTDLAASQDLADGKMHKYDLDGKAVVLLRDDDGLHAFNGTCPHLGGPLWEGELDDHCVTCPWHGSQFDVSDGRLLHGPSVYPVPSYDTRERNGRIEVRLEQA
jgi:nitrite reductase/ring-hydroxylating ferredoxin subunit/uncharacterized membrane protein